MAKICVEAEKTLNYRRVYNDIKLYTPGPVGTTEAVASAVCSAVLDQKDIALIIVLTETGKLARLVSKYRPEVKILGCSSNKSVIQQMNSTRGVFGMLIPSYNADQVVGNVLAQAKESKMIKPGQKVALVHGTNEETPDESNVMKILDA
jgi:pyruvate kinase